MENRNKKIGVLTAGDIMCYLKMARGWIKDIEFDIKNDKPSAVKKDARRVIERMRWIIKTTSKNVGV